jgi:predicted phage terminase large subunit-like protein
MRLRREDVAKITKKYDGPTARGILRTLFSQPENIPVFNWFCFGDTHFTLTSPEFHDEMTYDAATLPGNKGFAAPRGFAKSTTFDIGFTAWHIANKTKHFIVLMSDSYTQATDFTEGLQDAISSSEAFIWLYGDLRTDRWSRDDFITSSETRVVAKGQGMKIRGLKYRQWRPDLLVIDDLENDELVANYERRKKLKNWFTRSVLPALSADGEVVYIGTILHHDSLLNNIVKKNDEFSAWHTRLYKALLVDNKNREHSIWPEHLTVKTLKRMRDDPTYSKYEGSLVFAQERQNEPLSDEDSPIKEDWIKFIDSDQVPPDRLMARRVITVDPAISKKDTADPTAKAAMSLDKDENVYIYRLGNSKLSFKESVAEIVRWNNEEEPTAIGIETQAFQKALAEVLTGLPVVEFVRDNDKLRRTIAVSRHFEAGKVFIVRGIANANLLRDQLIEFPFATHDDLVDVVVDGLSMLLTKRIGTYGDHEIKPSENRPISAGVMNKDF